MNKQIQIPRLGLGGYHQPTSASVYLKNQKLSFNQLELSQQMGEHQHLRLVLDQKRNKLLNFSMLEEQSICLGSALKVSFGTTVLGEHLAHQHFHFVVSQITQEQKEGNHSYLVLEAQSPTILLEQGKSQQHYSQETLESIVGSLLPSSWDADYGLKVNPQSKQAIEFALQHQESNWEFLRRLCWEQNENLYFDGSQLIIGSLAEENIQRLCYDRELTKLEIKTRLLAQEKRFFHYQAESHHQNNQSLPAKLPQESPPLTELQAQSQSLFSTKQPASQTLYLASGNSQEMSDYLLREKEKTLSRMRIVGGISKVYGASLGSLVRIESPSKHQENHNHGVFRITKCVHSIDSHQRYHCAWEATSAALSTLHWERPPQAPKADSLLASVADTNDPKGQGRVQLRFAFSAKTCNKWMRVLSPSAGNQEDGSKARGMLFVPEVGDQVVVGFENLHPNYPYVKGSMFHSENHGEILPSNQIKHIVTKSGVRIVWDDGKGSAEFGDKAKSQMLLDGGGNFNLLATKNLRISAGKDILLEAGGSISFQGENIEHSAGEDIYLISHGLEEKEQQPKPKAQFASYHPEAAAVQKSSIGGAEFYDRQGNYLGRSNIEDKKIYLLNAGINFKGKNLELDSTGILTKNQIDKLKNVSTEVGGLIVQDRVDEGKDFTISNFRTISWGKNIEGYMLEPAGPSTKTPNQDKRIPEGVYSLENYSSKKYPDNFLLSNEDVPKSRLILYHSGNSGANTEGCNMPGSTKGNGFIGGSRAKMQELRTFIKGLGAKKVKTIINNKIPK